MYGDGLYDDGEGSGHFCIACHEEILEGERVYRFDEGLVHADEDCLWEHLLDSFGASEIARLAGGREETVWNYDGEGERYDV